MFFCFFFQAEDGIRARLVTGVHTCALPIYAAQPELTYSPSSFDVSLEPGQTNNESITIFNTGEEESSLYYFLTVSPFENVGGGPDANGNLWADSDNEPSISAEWIDISTIGTAYSFPNNDQAGSSIDISLDRKSVV